ncbi:hypothetical protein [Mycolicibacterium setense]|uniref:hypothetical protein n=1 Tax=Mycolicibacterium setense TaxID=431269 RepID=UPI001F3E0C59|nr:hypothetical protein [Mycolicibacterium setense]
MTPRRVTLVRRGLYIIAVLGVAATAFELATEQHWNSTEQLIPWAALAVLTCAIVLALLPARAAHLGARLLTVLVIAASAYGVIDHITVNHHSGPLDQRYAAQWDSTSTTQQWWYAATKGVGPTPPLAPAVLAQSALLVLFGSLLTPRRAEPEP